MGAPTARPPGPGPVGGTQPRPARRVPGQAEPSSLARGAAGGRRRRRRPRAAAGRCYAAAARAGGPRPVTARGAGSPRTCPHLARTCALRPAPSSAHVRWGSERVRLPPDIRAGVGVLHPSSHTGLGERDRGRECYSFPARADAGAARTSPGTSLRERERLHLSSPEADSGAARTSPGRSQR